MLKKAATVFLILIFLMVVAAPVATVFRKQPTLAVAIRTWSMSPLLTRGDLVFLWPAGENTRFSVGQIVVFRPGEDAGRDWTMHRIVGGDAESGFVTRGDANQYTDQETHYPPVRPEWIAGVVLAAGKVPLKIPLLGYLPIYLEQHLANHQTLIPILVGILAVALAFDELFKTRKRKRKEAISKSQLFFLGGLVFTVLMGSVMLAGSLFITFPYGVEETAGALMGSDVGVLKLGESRELELAELGNKSLLPSYYQVVSADPQVVPVESKYRLSRSEFVKVEVTVYAREKGLHQAHVTVGMFLPFLPFPVIAFLVQRNYWLGLVVVSLIPALPVFILPYLEPRHRRRFIKGWRRKLQQTAAVFRL